LEAMPTGCAVLTSRAATMPEVVLDGEVGTRHVARYDTPQIAARFIEAIRPVIAGR